MNAYDFDKTIYDGDSMVDFFIFSLKRDPSLLRFCIHQVIGFLLYAGKRIDKTKFKERFLCFLQGISNVDMEVEQFWHTYERRIKGWYLEQKTETDVIVSASPEFLLRPLCTKLGIGCLIASRVDASTGRIDGLNCYGKEKAVRFMEIFDGEKIMNFYSDSHSDDPLVALAENAWLVKGDTLQEWA